MANVKKHRNTSPEAVESNWQSGFQTINDTIRNVLLTGKLSDVTFVVGEEKKEVRAHTFILMSRSPVFEAMFERWDSSSSGPIFVEDADFDAFNAFLKARYDSWLH
jgi:hypothetical protein